MVYSRSELRRFLWINLCDNFFICTFEYINKNKQKIKIMTVLESLNKLKQTFIEFHVERTGDEDPGYVWWDRIKDCQRWCDKERSYVRMSNTQTLKIMRGWVKEQKQLANK